MSKVIGIALLVVSLSLIASADDVAKWVVQSPEKNTTCLMVSMEIKINFTYTAQDNSVKNVLYQIPSNAKEVEAESNCGVDDILVVSWNETNKFTMKFSENSTKYALSSFVIAMNTSSLYNDSKANQTVTVSYINESFDVPSNFSYHCNHEEFLNSTTGGIVISKVQFEAFKKGNDQKFSSAKDCDSKITPDIVPIAVGISLIALIVVVLIAYIVGRRRSQARGYLNIM